MDELRIAILLPFLHDGGVERAMLNLAHGLLGRRVDVDLVVATRIDGPFSQQIPRGVQCIELGARRGYWALPKLVRYMRYRSPYAVFAALTPANLLAIWARQLSRVKAKVIVNVQVSVGLPQSTAHLKAILRPSVYRAFYRYADAIVTPSHGVANDLSYLGVSGCRIHTIFNPVLPPQLEEKVNEPVQHPWFAQRDTPIILGAGRLHKQKDFPTLIKAFAIVRERTPARLIIIGEGSERIRLEQIIRELGIAEDVSLPGFVPNPYAYMAKASVFVLSSAWEGFGNVVAEALAVGTPVVSTDCPSGPAEILENGKWGRLVPVGDFKAMAQAIIETLENPPQRSALMERAKAFSIEDVTKQYLSVIEVV